MPNRWLRHKIDEFEQFAIDVIMGRREGTMAMLFGAFLQVCSYLFSGIVQLRLWLYRNRIFRDQPLGCLVVVVGNLTVGGTGKTPIVEMFAKALRDRGRKVAILSRGYKSKAPPLWQKWWFWLNHTEPPPPRVVSDGDQVLLDSELAGDEPFMLARNLPGVVVLVDKDRVKAGAYAIARFGCDTLVLDDGFQYLPLKGRLNLLLVDKTNPFGNGFLLPRGILREPIKHLQRASYVFLTKSKGVRDEELEGMIRRFNPAAEIIECAHKPQYLQLLGEGEPFRHAQGPEPVAGRLPLSALAGKRIGAFSGIAAPESFEAFLRDTGAKLGYTRRFLDHYRFTAEDLTEVFAEAQVAGVTMMITTEKDAVRLATAEKFPLPVYYLRLEIEILRGAADFQEAVGKICFPNGEPVVATTPPM
ncbi:MAG: tetraacyldisaccharide 4'-kinase [Lacunisphaera sp.]|nr:tetraacyldisaccharide 4'-kinase [Lacunisphaera sp.]